jgi:8-hydroxy-5-deazaflavin:NADPH oxidoreductase
MDVTIIGTGNIARGIGSRVIAGGHSLTVVGKDAEKAEAVVSDIGGGTATTDDPIEGDVVVLAVYYPDARSIVEQHGDQLAGKVVVDITNPVNETFATSRRRTRSLTLRATVGSTRSTPARRSAHANSRR